MSEAIARALGLARTGRSEEGIVLIDEAIASGCGLPLPTLLGLTPESVWSLLGPERARSFAEALRTRTALLMGAGRVLEAKRCEKMVGALERLEEARRG